MTPLLSVRDLEKRYGARIGCTDVSFDLYPGEVMGIETLKGRLRRVPGVTAMTRAATGWVHAPARKGDKP